MFFYKNVQSDLLLYPFVVFLQFYCILLFKLKVSLDLHNSNLASEFLRSYPTLELWHKPIDKLNQKAAINIVELWKRNHTMWKLLLTYFYLINHLIPQTTNVLNIPTKNVPFDLSFLKLETQMVEEEMKTIWYPMEWNAMKNIIVHQFWDNLKVWQII